MSTATLSLLDAVLPRAQAALPSPTDDFWYGPVSGSAAGQNVNGSSALTFSGCWAATNAIAGLFGAMPCKTFKKTPDGREETPKHAVHKALSREPNPEMDSFVFWEMMTQWWVNYGNAFAEIQRTESSNSVYALWPIHPTRVKPERSGSGEWTGRWEVRRNNGPPNVLDSNEVFNIVGHLSDDGLIGKGVLYVAAKAIGVGLAEQKYQGGFYESGGNPSGILEHPKTLSPSARDALRREWKTIHREGNEVAILWEGMKFTKTSVDPEHAQLIESRVFSIQEMSRFYDLPPHVLYELSKGTFANTEEMNRFLVSQSLYRRMVRAEKACDRQLFTESEKAAGYYTKFNPTALLHGDPKQQAEVLAIELQNGVTSQDEWRAIKDRNKLPDGQGKNHWIRRDMATLDLVLRSGGEVPGGESAPGAPKPDTPPKPPVPTPEENRLNALVAEMQIENAELGGVVQSLKSQIEEKDDLIKCESEATAQARFERDELLKIKCGLAVELDSVKSECGVKDGEIATLNAALDSEKAENKSHRLTIDANIGEILEFKSKCREASESLVAAQLERDSALTARDKAQRELGAVQKQLERSDHMIGALDSEAKATKAALEAAEASKSKVESQLADLKSKLSVTETERDRANKRGDDFKATNEKLSIQVGSLRAETVAMQTQLTSLTNTRDETVRMLAECKESLKTAESERLTVENALKQANIDSEQAKAAARMAVCGSLRGLLDESLQLLLNDEQAWVKEAARKPEQFKEIVNGHYHHFGQRLLGQLTQAASAIEQLGGERVDVAKIASDYVAESRTKLNNVFHTTKREELRVAIRDELVLWEGRQKTLLDWIGA